MKYLIVLLLLCCFACSNPNKVPKDVLGADKMQVVLWDLIRADELAQVTKDSAQNITEKSLVLYEQVFAIHKTSRGEIDKSIQWYQHHPDVLKPILDSLNRKAQLILQEQYKPRADSIRPITPNIADSIRARINNPA